MQYLCFFMFSSAILNMMSRCSSLPALLPPAAADRYVWYVFSPMTYLLRVSFWSPSSACGYLILRYLSRTSRSMAPERCFSLRFGNIIMIRDCNCSRNQSLLSKCVRWIIAASSGENSGLLAPRFGIYFSTDTSRPHFFTDMPATSLQSVVTSPSNGTGLDLNTALAAIPCSSVCMTKAWLGRRCSSSVETGIMARTSLAVFSSHLPVITVLHTPVISPAKSLSYALHVCVAMVTFTPNFLRALSISDIVEFENMCASST